jgi:hypothetical protein
MKGVTSSMSKQELIQLIRTLPPETVIPKPEAHGDFVVKEMGRRADQDALIYKIPTIKLRQSLIRKA